MPRIYDLIDEFYFIDSRVCFLLCAHSTILWRWRYCFFLHILSLRGGARKEKVSTTSQFCHKSVTIGLWVLINVLLELAKFYSNYPSLVIKAILLGPIIQFLPVYHPSDEEMNNPKLYARNVQILMARYVRIVETFHVAGACICRCFSEKE